MSFGINKKDGVKILQKFFELDYDLDKASALFISSKRSKQQVVSFIKTKFRQIILQIESSLFSAGKIDELKLSDNSSDKMFEDFMKLQDYFPKQLNYDFVFEEKCKHQKVQKSSTGKKMELYSIFLNYAEKNNLYKYVYVSSQKAITNKRTSSNWDMMYEPHEFEILGFYYEICGGDYQQIQSKLKQRGFLQLKFQGESLYRVFKNMQLIGLYQCYLESICADKEKGLNWQKFVRYEEEKLEIIEKFDQNMKNALIQIALRNQTDPFFVKLVCRKIGRKYSQKPFIAAQKMAPPNDSEQSCNAPEITSLRAQMMQVLKEKIRFTQQLPNI